MVLILSFDRTETEAGGTLSNLPYSLDFGTFVKLGNSHHRIRPVEVTTVYLFRLIESLPDAVGPLTLRR